MEDNIQRSSLLTDGNVENDTVIVEGASESNDHFTNTVNSDVARVLVVFKSYINLSRFLAICPMEIRRLKRLQFEHA